MRKKAIKQTNPRFDIGQTVFASVRKANREIIARSWNGLMWMYSFKDEALSCGEMYLSEVKQ